MKIKSAGYSTFALMLRNLLAFFFLGWTLSLLGQTGENPFDLKFRPAKRIQIVKPVPPGTKADSVQFQQKTSSPDTIIPAPVAVPEDTSIMNLGATPVDTPSNQKALNPFQISPGADTSRAGVQAESQQDTAQTANRPLVSPALIRNSLKGFQIFFLLLSLLFLIFIVNVERNYVRDLWRVIANENYSSLHYRNQRNTMRQILLWMGYAVFIFQSGIFIYHALRIFHYQGDVKLTIWLPMTMVLGIYTVRHLVIRYLRWLFDNDKEMTLFGFDISIFNIMVGLVLLPINVLLVFGPESMYKPLIVIGLITMVTAYLLRQLRWLLTARGLISHSLFLFFIYLCAVEILPLWALSKYFW